MLGGNIFSKINFSFGVLTLFKLLIEFIFPSYNMLTQGAPTNCPNGGMLPLHNDHAIGSYDTFTFTNPLISANRSMLFLTIVEDGAYGTGTSHPNCTLTASIDSISDGQAVIKVTLHGNPFDIMSATPKINYLIINE